MASRKEGETKKKFYKNNKKMGSSSDILNWLPLENQVQTREEINEEHDDAVTLEREWRKGKMDVQTGLLKSR